MFDSIKNVTQQSWESIPSESPKSVINSYEQAHTPTEGLRKEIGIHNV